MADNERIDRTLVQIDSDLASIRRTRLNVTQLGGAMDFVAKMGKQVDLATGKAGKSIRDAFGSQSSSRLNQMRGALDKNVESVDHLRKSLEKAAKAKKELTAAQLADERFGAISRDVGIIGDVESSLRATGASGLVPDLLGMAEALPRLKVGIQNLPAQLDAAAEALGTNRTGFIGGIGLAAIGLVGFQLIANAFAADMERIRAANEEGIANATEYYNIISTGSKETIEGAIKQVEIQQRVNSNLIASFEKILKLTDEAVAAQSTDLEAEAEKKLADALATLGIAIDDFDASQMRTEIDRLKGEIDVGALQINNYRDAINGLNDEAANAELLERGIKAVIDQRRFEMDALKLSTDQIKDRQQSIKDEMSLLELEIATRKANGQVTDELVQRWAELGQQEAYLSDVAYDLAKAREEEAEAAKFQEQQLKDAAAAIKKYNDDIESIEERSLEQRAAAADRYNEALVNAAETAADAAENALANLQEQRANLARDLGREESNARRDAQLEQLDTLIEFQRDEARALREHQRNLEQIRRDAARQEEDLIANRDFAGLFRLRRDTGFRLEDTNRDFNAERQEQAQAFREQLQDQVAQYARERDQRAAKYAQDLADAQAQYNAEIAQADANRREMQKKAFRAYQDDLKAIDAKLRTEVNAKRAAHQADLQLINQTAQVRAQIFQQELNEAERVLSLLRSRAAGTGGSATHPGRQYGGSVRRGQTVNVNERRPESFTSNGRTTDFPRSPGLFTPNQAGRVNSRAGANVNMDVDFNLAGNMNNPEAIWRALEPRFTRLLERYFGAA